MSYKAFTMMYLDSYLMKYDICNIFKHLKGTLRVLTSTKANIPF